MPSSRCRSEPIAKVESSQGPPEQTPPQLISTMDVSPELSSNRVEQECEDAKARWQDVGTWWEEERCDEWRDHGYADLVHAKSANNERLTMGKRKATFIEEDLIVNNGSKSDDSANRYLPRAAMQQVHDVLTESITFTTNGKARSSWSNFPTPASPAKKSKIVLQLDPSPADAEENLHRNWDADFADFDAEYRPGIDEGPCAKRDSVRQGDSPFFHIDFWVCDDRKHFLDELLRHDGRGDYTALMAVCTAKTASRLFTTGPPFHHLEEWVDNHFERRALKSFGVCLQLGHPPGVRCTNPEKAWGDAFVIVDSHTIHEALRQFAHMTLESKCSMYKFYNSPTRPLRGILEDDVTVATPYVAESGELALLCPACPHPGINLPVNWDKVPFEKAFLYALFLAIDTNFHLKRKDVSSKEDLGLSKGWVFFGEVGPYMEHLKDNWQQTQPPDHESHGTASSGIGTVDCACHNMKCPNGVGDLQQGEKYLNMDYLYFMTLLGTLLLCFIVSYDIACQWYKNLWERMRIFPLEAQLGGEKKFMFLVPKFHLPAHIEECNAPKHGWADANHLANSTSILGPGAWCDTLDTHFQYSNWKKITKLGTVLLDKIQKSMLMMLETLAAWVDVEASFEQSVTEAWTLMAIAWEVDSKNPNPFASTAQHKGIAKVRLRLAGIAAADVGHEGVRDDMHETEMLSMGLQLEQQQIGAHETVYQETKCLERETKLQRKINSWMAIQQLFIPELVPGLKVQDISLWLPSAIATCAQCPAWLQEYEFQLQQGQAVWVLKYIYWDGVHGTKVKLRSGSRTDVIQLCIDSLAAEYRTVRAALVKLGAILKQTEWQQYLRPLLAEDVRGRPCTTFGDPEQQRGGGGKKKKRAQPPAEMLWIWYLVGKTGKPEDVVKSEHKMRAKAMWYAEEIDLVEEEMWRVLQFLRWRRDWWKAWAELRIQVDGAFQDGQAAYTKKQAGYMHGLREHFKQLWRYIPQELRMSREEYATMTPDDVETTDGVQEQQPNLATSVVVEIATELEQELAHK
ncbi:hypothetical protein B0H14DRAFT_3511096 [Mycena olivaceomarginata]|nr:hypothetical protein B0H14DRAFT_3511096 [Mycena olivaceomarginata]